MNPEERRQLKLCILDWLSPNVSATSKEINRTFPTAPLLEMERDGSVTFDPRTKKWRKADWTPEEILAREG